MSGRAWVNVSSEFIGDLLGLPKGVRIVRADMSGYGFGMRLGLEGTMLPKSDPSREVESVLLNLRQEDSWPDGTSRGVRKIYGSFSHAPDKEWLVTERPLPPLNDGDVIALSRGEAA